MLSASQHRELVQQDDGNLVVHNREPGKAIGAVNKCGQGNFLAFQCDGNYVEYAPGNWVLWSPNIWGSGGCALLRQGEVNPVAHASDGRAIGPRNTADTLRCDRRNLSGRTVIDARGGPSHAIQQS